MPSGCIVLLARTPLGGAYLGEKTLIRPDVSDTGSGSCQPRHSDTIRPPRGHRAAINVTFCASQVDTVLPKGHSSPGTIKSWVGKQEPPRLIAVALFPNLSLSPLFTLCPRQFSRERRFLSIPKLTENLDLLQNRCLVRC